MNSIQRRTFRGRGGPTDGRLPKHNARRRRAPDQLPHKPKVNKYQEEDSEDAGVTSALVEEAGFSNGGNENDASAMGESSSTPAAPADIQESTSDDEERALTENIHLASLSQTVATNTDGNGSEKQNGNSNPCIKEVQHLKKRVRNIRETLSLSNSISNPKTYQDNVLNAVSNCVNEWRSIVTHYPPPPAAVSDSNSVDDNHNTTTHDPVQNQNGAQDNTAEDENEFYLPSELKKEAALAVFEMIQQSIQAGPLAGGKPGYFKRCGGEVAKVVDIFLDQVIPHTPALVQRMGFTSKQMDAMTTWKKNAQKAVVENKPPSRTALKHQQGKGTGKKAKKKMKGKQ